MGRDKATLLVDGVPMALRVAWALVDGGCNDVLAIGGDTAALGAMGLEVVADDYPGEGPLGAILTALAHLPDEVDAVCITSCDLPWLTGETVAALIGALVDHDLAVARAAGSAWAEPLCAAWHRNLFGPLQSVFVAGERAVHRAMVNLDSTEVTVRPHSVTNVNDQGDLQVG
jgi:molybdopterin-guanine dinucleotide biosynthesis protein A